MALSFPSFLGLVEVLLFLIFDFLYAHELSGHKNKHPELEECAPASSPDLDPVKVLDTLAASAVEVVEQQRDRLTDSGVFSFSAARGSGSWEALPGEDSAVRGLCGSVSLLHATVVLCGIAAPVLTFIALLFPSAFAWMFFPFPAWFSYLFVAPGLGATVLYAARVIMFLELVEVSKTQWISMMWFRLDFIFIMSAVALLGAGAWLVAICMLSVAAYSVHRVIKIEKHLNRVQRDTQLIRGEVDVSRVLKPGTEASKKAMGIHEGYSVPRL